MKYSKDILVDYSQIIDFVYTHSPKKGIYEKGDIFILDCESGLRKFFVISRLWDSYSSTEGYILYDMYFEEYIIVFKGSKEIKDWFYDFMFFKTFFLRYNDKDIMIHKGFYKSWKTIQNKLIREISDIFLKKENKPITLLGHSLGGALATILFSYLNFYDYDYTKNCRLVTFGAPKVFNNVGAEFLDNISSNKLKIINKGDIVSLLPFNGYKHFEKNTLILSDEKAYFNIDMLYIPKRDAHDMKEYRNKIKKLWRTR